MEDSTFNLFADYGYCAKLLCGEWTLKLNISNQQFTKMIQYLWRAAELSPTNNVCIQGVLSNQQTQLFRLLNFHCISIHFVWKKGNFITCMCLIKITDKYCRSGLYYVMIKYLSCILDGALMFTTFGIYEFSWWRIVKSSFG